MRSVDGPQAERARLEAASRWRILGEKWAGNLAELRRDGVPFDLVVFTGDLGDWGHPTDYPRALAFLRETCTALDVSLDWLFIIPGNHDIDRKAQVAAWKWVRNKFGDDPRAYSEWMAGLGSRKLRRNHRRDQLLERQQAFWAAVAKDLGRSELEPRNSPHKRLGYRQPVTLPGLSQPIHVIGLDTAWLAGDEYDGGKLRLTEHQVSLLTTDGGAPLRGFRLALMHHRLVDLADVADARRWMADRIDLLLHGHQHEPTADLFQGPDHQLLVLATGCLYEGDEGDRYPNAYQVIDLALDEHSRPRSAEIRFRGWSSRGLFWGDDALLYQSARRGHLRLGRGERGWRFEEGREEQRETTLASDTALGEKPAFDSGAPNPSLSQADLFDSTTGRPTGRQYLFDHKQPASQVPYERHEGNTVVNLVEPNASNVPRHLSLRFIIGKYKGAEFRLPTSGMIRVGRASELEVVLAEDRMSRIHAEILISHGVVTISDQGSTNGTYVNAKRITGTARLVMGDRILVGTSLIRLAAATGSGPGLEEARKHVEMHSATQGIGTLDRMSGLLDEIPLEDLLRLLTTSRKTGVLTVQAETEFGRIYLSDGEVVGAFISSNGDMSGRGAFLEIFTWRIGIFEFRHATTIGSVFGVIEDETEHLLADGLNGIPRS